MILNRKRNKGAVGAPFLFGILLFFLVAAGGILVLSGQQDKALLTADIFQVVDDINAEDSSVKADETPEDVSTELQPTPEPTQPQPQANTVSSQKVWVSPTSVPAGGDITVTVDTSDISGIILFVDVYLESENSGQTVQGSIVSIDGEGRRFGNLTIPSDAEQGTWVIKKVSIMGVSGSPTDYHDGQDMSAVFTVTSP
tara:strand:- start:1651 stop:2244 length:594 start_codon:yes stop_codon:yes gene_type:complete